MAQVFYLADGMPNRRFRALRRHDIAPDGSTVRVALAHTEVGGRGIVVGPPKSRAGVRTIAIPSAIRPDLVAHLAESLVDMPAFDAQSEADRLIADSLSSLIEKHRGDQEEPDGEDSDGASGSLIPVA